MRQLTAPSPAFTLRLSSQVWATVAGVVISASAHAEDDAGAATAPFEHTIIVGVGGAAEFELRDRTVHAGPSVSVEWEAIDSLLELELGASVLASDHGAEVPVELLFKKPFQLSRGVEMMVGVGPELVYSSNPGKAYIGAEAALDFMFWPSRHVGFWVEPSYDVVFEDRGTGGVGSTGGVIFGW